MNEQQSNVDIEIEQDLKNDFNEIDHGGSSGETENIVEVIPNFIPSHIIKLIVAGKNGLIVHFLAKNLPLATKDILKDHYKPTDHEINIYQRFLESIIWKHCRQVAEWFLKNDVTTLMGEIAIFETVRALPILPLLKGEQKPEEKNEQEQGAV